MVTFSQFLNETHTKDVFGIAPVDILSDPTLSKKSEAAFRKARRNPQLKRIDPTRVIPTQFDVSKGQIQSIIDHWPSDDWQNASPDYDDDEAIVVGVYGGNHYILDGHHRLAAALRLKKQPFGVEIPM